MKHHLLVIAITCVVAFNFCACGGSVSDDKSNHPDKSDRLVDKLDDAAKQMKERQRKRWDSVKSNLKNNPEWLNQYESVIPGSNKRFLTEPVEVLVAEHFIQLYQTNTPLTAISQRGGTLSVKRTESVWIDKQAILAFARTILANDSIDGIRIYNAQYPDNASSVDAGLDASCNGRKTIIFTATAKMPDGRVHVDMFLPKPRGPVKLPTDGLYVYDYNSLCPDDCSGATLGGNP